MRCRLPTECGRTPGRGACSNCHPALLAQAAGPGGSARPDEPGEHLADLYPSGAGDCRRITGGEGAQLVLVLGLDDTKPPRTVAVQYRTEDDHLAGVDERLPVGRMAGHDVSLLGGHIKREV